MSKHTNKRIQEIADTLEVTNYLDYRDYLRDLYGKLKAEFSPYSYETFAEDLGFSPTNSIRLVIAHQRSLSLKSAVTVADALGIRRKRRQYFLAMTQYVHARGGKLKEQHFKKMLAAKQACLQSHRSRESLEFLSEWYHLVILEILKMDKKLSSSAEIMKRLYPELSQEKIRQSIALLESIGQISVEKSTGRIEFKNHSPILIQDDDSANYLAMCEHHHAMLDVAKEVLSKVPPEQREFHALTVGLSLDAFAKAKELVKELCGKILALESSDKKSDCVAQVNINLFALTKRSDDHE